MRKYKRVLGMISLYQYRKTTIKRNPLLICAVLRGRCMAGQRICDDVSYEGGSVTHALKGETRAVERNGSQLRSVEERDRRLR
jgi:hypothetical protein